MSSQRIKSFAVLDLETANLPSYNFNKGTITEICIYGFSADVLLQNDKEKNGYNKIPRNPRNLQKLTLLINPQSMINPIAENLTGLNNYMLEREQPFNEMTANLILTFLARLEKPLCLVAHNGINFDFPILNQMFEKINMSLPADTLCVDSLTGFWVLDIMREKNEQIFENDVLPPLPLVEDYKVEGTDTKDTDTLLTDKFINHNAEEVRICNENTPNRPTTLYRNISKKRKLNFHSNHSPNLLQEQTMEKKLCSISVRRSLFHKLPPAGKYRLNNIYRRVFKIEHDNVHQAEADVEMLTKLMLYFGSEFLQYAQKNATNIADIPQLGSHLKYFY